MPLTTIFVLPTQDEQPLLRTSCIPLVNCLTQLICTWIFICCVPWQSKKNTAGKSATNDKNVSGLFFSTNQTIYHLSKEKKWLIAKTMSHAWSARCALPTCRYGLMGWFGGVVQGWEGKCKIANLSFILTPRHFRALWGWAMMSTSAWYRCLRQHCRPIALKSGQAFYVKQDYSVSILNLLLVCWNGIY